MKTLSIAVRSTLVLIGLSAVPCTALATAEKCAYKLWDIAGIPYPVPIGQVCQKVWGTSLTVNNWRASWDPLGPGRRICNYRAAFSIYPPVGQGPVSHYQTNWTSGCRYISVNFELGSAAWFPGYGRMPFNLPNHTVMRARIEETNDNGRTWHTYLYAPNIEVKR